VVCREFLKLGTGNPADFEAVKLLFPYLRETSVCRTPREWQFVADCQYFAFYAGHDLGCRHPELVESILPGDEVKEAKRRLQILQQCGDEERITPRSLDLAFKAVAESHRPTKPEVNVDALVCSLILRSARVGFAAGTVALNVQTSANGSFIVSSSHGKQDNAQKESGGGGVRAAGEPLPG
jgi:hypothetical protein